MLNRHLISKYACNFKPIISRRLHYKPKVKVRFAPSPTGYLHLGGLRTALYNHLFALSNNGEAILRIEDTDQDRKVPDAVPRLVEDLSWAGLTYKSKPIYQSDRIDLYKHFCNSLLASKKAYRCFCSPTRLDLLRREALKLGQVPKYDSRCRFLSEDQIHEKLRTEQPFCIRFIFSSSLEPFNDLVYGETKLSTSSEGDFVILKTDGFPTYHLANVVDDHDMGITHVLRGVEWQTSTSKHLSLYRAFGWNPPQFAHLPLLLNSDGSKLSKRQGDIDIRHFKNKGVFPLALLNFVVRSGGGFDLEQSERDRNIFTLEEMSIKFDLNKVSGSSGKVEFDKLPATNQLELKRLLKNNETGQKLVLDTINLLENHFQDRDDVDVTFENVRKILLWAQDRIFYLNDLLLPEWKYVWVLPQSPILTLEEKSVVEEVSKELFNIDYEPDVLKSCLKKISQQRRVSTSSLMKLLRKVLSGLKEGPSVVEMMVVLGKSTVNQRLQSAVKEVH